MSAAVVAASKDAAGAPARPTKLQVIQAAIEMGNLRKALLLLDNKDVAHLPGAKALRAWALDRNGNRDEAMDIALELMRSKPSDLTSVIAIGNVLRAAG